jgi:6-phosphogluconolactonase (cycloisomerase 2 family)
MIYKVTTKDFKGESRTIRAKLDDELKAFIPAEGLKLTAPIAVGVNKKVELTYSVTEEGAIVSFQLDKENDKFSIAEVIIQFAKDLIIWKKVS